MNRLIFGLSTLFLLCGTALAGGEAYSTAITVEKVLSTDTTALGQKLHLPDSAAAVTGIVVTIPSGAETGWHTHPYSGVAYIIEGVLTVETEKGSTTYPAGTSFAEVYDFAHNGKNKGKDPVKLVAFFMGTSGAPISAKIANHTH